MPGVRQMTNQPTGYHRINLSFAVALYGRTEDERNAEIEWLKKAILAYAQDHPDEMSDCVKIASGESLTKAQYDALEPDPEQDQAELWANDPRA